MKYTKRELKRDLKLFDKQLDTFDYFMSKMIENAKKRVEAGKKKAA